MKTAYLLLGWCCFSLGAVGTVVPGLPTVPLMLVALWAFSRSSQRFHDWLYSHPVFGPPLQQWNNHRVIPARAKLLAVATMAVSAAYLVFFTTVDPWLKAAVILLMLYGAVFIVSKPSRISE